MAIPTIDPFDFPTPYEVVGYGRMRHNFARPAEVQIEVLLSPVLPSGMVSPHTGDLVTRAIGCGQFDLVPIGSVWCKRERLSQRQGLRRISADVAFGGDGSLASFGYTPNGHSYPFPSDMPVFRLRLEPPVGKIAWAWVPIAELVRVLFGVSSHFLVQMFGGVRTPDMQPDSAFFDRALCGPDELDPRIFKLVCTENPTDVVALTTAAMLATAAFCNAHDSIFRELARGDRTDPRGVPIRMSFPFLGVSTTWRFEGRPVAWRPRDAPRPNVASQSGAAGDGTPKNVMQSFLITRILHVRFPVPFDQITIWTGRLKIEEGMPPPEGRTIVGSAKRARLQSQRPAASGGALVPASTDGAVIEAERPIDIIRLPPAGVRGKSGFVVFDPVDERLGSTADRQAGGDPAVAHVVLERRKASAEARRHLQESVWPSQLATFGAIRSLAHERGWPIVRERLGEADDIPILDRLGDAEDSMPILLMCVRCPAGAVFVADAGTAFGDGRSVGLLLLEDARISVAEGCARILESAKTFRGSWRGREVTGFRVVAVARQPSEIWNDPIRYRQLLANAIDGFV